jgi:hypothetical protein
MSGFIKTAAIAAFTAILGLGAAANAASGVVTVNSGSTYDGWKIFFPEGEGVSLVEDVQTNTLQLVLEKDAQFNSTQSYLITFMQDKTVSAPATSIVIANESITNNSGVDWSGFSFSLLTPFTGPAFAAGDAFVPPSPYYSTVSTSSSVISYGGNQPDGTVSLWNQTPASGSLSNQLVINSDPIAGGVQSFSFKELPLVSVPVPAAAWTGLTGLLGLAAIAYGKNIKKILA